MLPHVSAGWAHGERVKGWSRAVLETPDFSPGSTSCRAQPRVSTRSSQTVPRALPVQVRLRLGYAHIAQAPDKVAHVPERILLESRELWEGLAQVPGPLGLESLAKRKDLKAGSNEQKVADFYESCMDEPAIEAAGAKPLQPELERVAAVKDLLGLEEEMIVSHPCSGSVGRKIGPSSRSAKGKRARRARPQSEFTNNQQPGTNNHRLVLRRYPSRKVQRPGAVAD